MPESAIYFMVVNQRNREQTIKEVERLLCMLNDEWMKKVKEYLKDAYNSLEGNIRYFKIV